MVSEQQGKASRPAAVVLSCRDPEATASFFVEKLGFRVDAVFPADDPRVVEISGRELHVRLERGDGDPGVLCFEGPGEDEWTAPNGTRIRFVPSDRPVAVPSLESSFVLTRMSEGSGWHTGRAGMEYRDLIPDRQGGWIIASHIRIPEGGPVPDYVHFHRIRFQMIYCLTGWVRVVYEDQGVPFVLEAGDCVLQPPRIRHRVLECSPGLEVIEVSVPAEHETRADHDLPLPNIGNRTDRDFEGQKFLRHVASHAAWDAWRADGFHARETGMAAATGGLAGARVVRPLEEGTTSEVLTIGSEVCFLFVAKGSSRLKVDGRDEPVQRGDAVLLPPKTPHALTGCSGDLEFLEVWASPDGIAG